MSNIFEDNFNLNKAHHDSIIKSSEGQHWHKEGNKHIYEGSGVKTPLGHGKVVSIKRHPFDIHHIQNVRVKINDKEHDFSPNDIHAHINELSEGDKQKFSKLVSLTKDLGLANKNKFELNLDNYNNVIANYEKLLHSDIQARAYFRRGEGIKPEHEEKIKHIVELSKELKPSLKKLDAIRSEAAIQQVQYGKEKPTDWEGMKEFTGPLRKGEEILPTNHKAAMRVPKGGSSCSKCKFIGDDKKSCKNEYFIKWNNGNAKLPYPADEYCSDWFEPARGELSKAYEVLGISIEKGGVGSGRKDTGHKLAQELELHRPKLKALENEAEMLSSTISDINSNSNRSAFDKKKVEFYRKRLADINGKIDELRKKIGKINQDYNPDSEFEA